MGGVALGLDEEDFFLRDPAADAGKLLVGQVRFHGVFVRLFRGDDEVVQAGGTQRFEHGAPVPLFVEQFQRGVAHAEAEGAEGAGGALELAEEALAVGQGVAFGAEHQGIHALVEGVDFRVELRADLREFVVAFQHKGVAFELAVGDGVQDGVEFGAAGDVGIGFESVGFRRHKVCRFGGR